MFRNTKLSIKGKKTLFSNILGWSEKGKQTSIFFRPNTFNPVLKVVMTKNARNDMGYLLMLIRWDGNLKNNTDESSY